MERRWSYFESKPFGVSSVEKCGARLISKILSKLWSLKCIHSDLFFHVEWALLFHKQISPLSSLKNTVVDHDIVNSTCVLSHFRHVWLFVTLWTVAYQVPLSMGFSRQEYWSGLPCPPPGDLPDTGIKPSSPASPVPVSSPRCPRLNLDVHQRWSGPFTVGLIVTGKALEQSPQGVKTESG